MRLPGYILVILTALWCVDTKEDATFWTNQAREELRKTLGVVPNTNIAKNVILFVGDGMGISTVMAARVLRGQLKNQTGEESLLGFETLPNVGLLKVYNTDKQVPDSAGTATALMSGVKTARRIINLDPTLTTVGQCSNNKRAELSNMMNWSMKRGKDVGIVTTTRITHATPAAAYAITPNRDWENDHNVQPPCEDIADQLINARENWDIKVILGGGRSMFYPSTVPDPGTKKVESSHRNDGRNLVQEWADDKERRGRNHSYVWNKGQFDSIDPESTEYLLGLFSPSHMSFDLDRPKDPNGEPSIAEMTEKALKILQKDEDGYFLLVEGGRIDHAHHVTNAKRALYDTLAFDDAVQVAMGMTNESDTLIIVTADHSHVMTVAGYPDRGNGILDVASNDQSDSLGSDSLPYTTLMYTNGPLVESQRTNLTLVDTTANDFIQRAAVPMAYETHSGEDVAVYSRGPMSHLLSGVKEQNYVAMVMAHAACVDQTGIACATGRPWFSIPINSSSQTFEISSFLLFTCIIVYFHTRKALFS